MVVIGIVGQENLLAWTCVLTTQMYYWNVDQTITVLFHLRSVCFSFLQTVDPNFYSKNLLLLGKTYLKLHNRKLAAFWLVKARDYPAHTDQDRQVSISTQ